MTFSALAGQGALRVADGLNGLDDGAHPAHVFGKFLRPATRAFELHAERLQTLDALARGRDEALAGLAKPIDLPLQNSCAPLLVPPMMEHPAGAGLELRDLVFEELARLPLVRKLGLERRQGGRGSWPFLSRLGGELLTDRSQDFRD